MRFRGAYPVIFLLYCGVSVPASSAPKTSCTDVHLLARLARSQITVAVELANGGLSYIIPNREAYPQGQYEVISARLGPGAGETLVDNALSQLDTLAQHPQPAQYH